VSRLYPERRRRSETRKQRTRKEGEEGEGKEEEEPEIFFFSVLEKFRFNKNDSISNNKEPVVSTI
jgi:hypothetical protein